MRPFNIKSRISSAEKILVDGTDTLPVCTYVCAYVRKRLSDNFCLCVHFSFHYITAGYAGEK